MSCNKYVVPWFVTIMLFYFVIMAPAQAALTDGLVAYYPFNGNANDASGNGNNGTVNGATLTADRFGNPNSAYEFNGTNSYIYINKPVPSAIATTNAITLSAWIRPAAYPSSSNLWMIVGSQCDACGSTGASIHLDGRNVHGGRSGGIHFQIGLENQGYTTTSNEGTTDVIIPIANWSHVVATWQSGETKKVYINGQLVKEWPTLWTGNIAYNVNTEMDIGRESDRSDRYFNGSVGDARIYNRALSAAEVQLLYGYTQIYSNDFSASAGTEWSDRTISTSNGEAFLADNAKGSGAGSNTLTLNNLPTHNKLQVSFDLYIIQSWDGNGGAGPDNWQLTADGNNVFLTNFANYPGGNTQAYPNQLPPYGTGGSFAPYTGAFATGHLGFGSGSFGDATYRLTYTFPHTASSVALAFTGMENQAPGDEGWGLDNVTVAVPVTNIVTPRTGLNGSISPNNARSISYGDTASFTITPNPNYNAQISGTCGGTPSTGTASFTYTTNPVISDCTVIASFALKTYKVTPTPTINGTISPNTVQTVSYGSTTSFTVTPDTGYSLASITGCNGTLRGTTYTTGQITGDCTVEAVFGKSLTSGLTVNNDNVTAGSWVYYFVTVPTDATDLTFVTTNSTGDVDIYTQFTTKPTLTSYDCRPYVDGDGNETCSKANPAPGIWWLGVYGYATANYSVTATITNPNSSHVVTPTAGIGGIINPSTAQTVAYAATSTFTATPNSGYTLNSTVEGTCTKGSWSGNTWTTGAIITDCTVIFSFTPISYTVTPSAGNGGIISPNTVQTAVYGTTEVFTVTPNNGYVASVSGTCGGNLSGTTYTTNPITANCTVIAAFTVPCTASWTPQTSGITNIIGGIVWNGSQFTAVADSGVVITSPEGINWTKRNNAGTSTLNGIAWSGTQFAAVAGLYDRSLIYTSPDGITWAEHVSTGNPVLRGVVWNGSLNKLIAVGEQGAILSSTPDATTWSVAQTGKAYTLNAITSTGSLQVAVGTGGTILISTDGITWTQSTSPISTVNLLTVIWNGTQFLAAGDKPLVLSSLDGITWTKTDITTPANMNFYRITWNGSRYIGVGTMGLATSNDGQTWTIASTQATNLRDIAWSGNELIAVGDAGTVLRYCISGQLDVTTAVNYDVSPASMPGLEAYGIGQRSTVSNFMVNAKVFATQTGTIEPGGQLSLSLNGTLKATIYDPQLDLTFHNLQTGDTITALYSGTDKYRRSSGSVKVGDAFTLTVTTNGTGIGTVKTNQTTSPDILCGGGNSNCTQQYSKSTPATVTLIATPASGSTFTGWSGDCAGTVATCTVSMTTTRNVTATFTINSTPTSYTVTPIINIGGTVTPSTPQTVAANTAKSFTVVPKTGYIKNSKGVSGTCPLGHWGGNVWTTGNITANCSVNFNFLCLACIPGQSGWRTILKAY